MKKSSLVIILTLAFTGVVNLLDAQDIIVMRNGDEIKAKVTEVGENEIKYHKFDNLTGPIYTVKKAEVFMIRYENGSKDVFNETVPSKLPSSTEVEEPDNGEVVKGDENIKGMTPPEGKALVFVYRPSSAGFAIRMEVSCDGKSIGSTKGNRYVYAVVNPGKHEFRSKAENVAGLEVELEANKTYFILQQVKMGVWAARTGLELTQDEADARKKLGHCKLSSDIGD